MHRPYYTTRTYNIQQSVSVIPSTTGDGPPTEIKGRRKISVHTIIIILFYSFGAAIEKHVWLLKKSQEEIIVIKYMYNMFIIYTIYITNSPRLEAETRRRRSDVYNCFPSVHLILLFNSSLLNMMVITV